MNVRVYILHMFQSRVPSPLSATHRSKTLNYLGEQVPCKSIQMGTGFLNGGLRGVYDGRLNLVRSTSPHWRPLGRMQWWVDLYKIDYHMVDTVRWWYCWMCWKVNVPNTIDLPVTQAQFHAFFSWPDISQPPDWEVAEEDNCSKDLKPEMFRKGGNLSRFMYVKERAFRSTMRRVTDLF